MSFKTFQASSMADCLTLVKAELGPTAVILHTRRIERRRWLGFRKFEIVEITAGRSSELGQRRRPPPPTNVRLAAAPRFAAAPVPPIRPGAELLNSAAVSNITVLALKNEIETVKTLLKDISSGIHHNPDVPKELVEHYKQLLQSQVADELAREIIIKVRDTVRPEHLSQRDFIRDRIADCLDKLIPTSGRLNRTKTSGPHVVALIGPTGVGKTTTVAKLAADLIFREHRKVGLITIDTYRIAAIDQLKRYADILNITLKVVTTPDDIRLAVEDLKDCEFILVDTAGRSPKDTLKLNELKALLAAAKVDETHLVLSSTASQACAELAVERFSEVCFDKVIFTKLDEAAQVGVLLNLVRNLNKSISYITTGQDVPDDIEVGHGRRLAQLILGMSL